MGRDCPSETTTTPKPDDGTSKPKANVDRDFTFRDSTNTNNRNSNEEQHHSDSKKGLRKLQRKPSAEEYASLPFIEGTTKLCSVSVGGKTCGGKHRHAKCPMLPAAKAERAAQAAVSCNPAAVFALPGQDPGQGLAVIRVPADPNWRCDPCIPPVIAAPAASPVKPTAWEFDYGVVIQIVFAVLLLSVVHVVASIPAAGPAGAITGAVFDAPIYSFHDIACSSVAFFILGGVPACLGTPAPPPPRESRAGDTHQLSTRPTG
jgi:hypothetical protein